MSILGFAWPIAGLWLLIGAPGFGMISAIICAFTIGLFRVDAPIARSQIATWGPFLFIGSISYSLYLVHFPIILLLKEHFGLVDGITLFAISYAVSLVLSAVLYLSVERPMNDLGKQFCKRLNPRSTKDAADIRLGTGKR